MRLPKFLRRIVRTVLSLTLGPVLRIPSVDTWVTRRMRELGRSANAGVPGAYKRLRLLETFIALLYPRPYYRVAILHTGESMNVDLSDTLGLNLYYQGPLTDNLELEVIGKLLSPGNVCLDVGANIGLYALTMARAVGHAGMVHALEPAPNTFSILEGNVHLNKREGIVTCVQVAASDKEGSATLHVTHQSGLSSLADRDRGTHAGTVDVPTITLDAYTMKHGLKPNFIKIDVEGYEQQVFEGARELLASSPNLIVFAELDDTNFAPLGYSVTSVLAWMKEQGYEAWALDRAGMQVLSARDEDFGTCINYLFAKNGGVGARRIREIAETIRKGGGL